MRLHGGGGGGQTSTNTIQKTDPWGPSQTVGMQYLANGQQLASDQIPIYQGQRLADLTPAQQQGIAGIESTAQNDQTTPAANTYAQDVLNGQYLSSNAGTNPFMGMTTNVGTNPYAGVNNPYLENVIGATNADITKAYSTGTAAQLDAAASRANALGSTGYAQQTDQNQYDLGKALAANTSAIRYGDYTNQQQLAEDALNRGTQAQEADLSRNSSLGDTALNRDLSLYQGERTNQQGALALAPSTAAAAYTDPNALLGAGTLQQQQLQAELANQQQIWGESALMPYRQLDLLGNVFQGGSGAGGTASSVATSPLYSSPLVGAGVGAVGGGFAGGAAAGAMYGSDAGPYGTAIGAVLGGLLGYFGSK